MAGSVTLREAINLLLLAAFAGFVELLIR